jgi:NAD(P)-dependent dehydrogenase (short-subunit alcohol dehydrogenase family)
MDIVVNNLGTFEPKSFEAIPDEDWRRLLEMNVLSGVRLARLYLPRMRRVNRILTVGTTDMRPDHVPG